MNSITLAGRLVADPVQIGTSNGISFCMAVSLDYVGKDGERGADFIDCVAWRGTGGFITRNFHKGDWIGIIGKLRSRVREIEGKKVRVYDVEADEVTFVGRKKLEQEDGQGI